MNEVTKIERIKHASIESALAAAQMDMAPAIKAATNPHFKSRYADLAAVVSACLPALNAHDIAVIQPFAEIDGQRYVVTAFIHESGGRLETMVPLIVQKNDMQGLGSAMTYARRYGLMSLAGIAPEDDDGNAAAKGAPAGNISEKQAEEIDSLISDTGTDPETFSKAFNVVSPDHLGSADFNRARAMLLKKKEKMQAEEVAAKADFEAEREDRD